MSFLSLHLLVFRRSGSAPFDGCEVLSAGPPTVAVLPAVAPSVPRARLPRAPFPPPPNCAHLSVLPNQSALSSSRMTWDEDTASLKALSRGTSEQTAPVLIMADIMTASATR